MTYTEEMTTSEILLRLASIRNELLQAVDDIEKISKNICYKVEQTEPIIEIYNGNADKENWQYITIKPIEAEPQTERPCDNCQEWDCYGCDYKQTERSE